ncbi:3-hydroxymethyl-3-methylglutaryl-coenzyme a lyase [Colletotrichum asianum]|uniref:hydroxymethylglutaryl-CoA lyase n=1 Tax=Colletotrichum asianum TaxID=702518 RepID=A0A8H3ZS92_9PEZI|nr:3-hydroxymethyl-3-methylglutaryl-coenzyme a lyase [Colletotrichum asianum]
MSVRIVEVGPRDGLQNVKSPIDTGDKLALIERLRQAGLQNIEITSVVSPKAIPQLADCRQVLSSGLIREWLRSSSDLRLPVLVPNTKGLQIALDHDVREVAVFVSATEGFSRANLNCSVDEGIQRAHQVATKAVSAGLAVRGQVKVSRNILRRYFAANSFSTTLDTFHAYLPTLSTVQRRCPPSTALLKRCSIWDATKSVSGIHWVWEQRRILAGHFHDTYGQALANVWKAYECGVRTFDSSVGGLGGCPFAPGAKGNVATEDVVYLFENAGVSTGVNLQKLAETGVWISKVLSKSNDSRAGAALSAKKTSRNTTSSKASPVSTEKVDWSLVRETERLLVYRFGATGNIVLNTPRNGNTLTSPMIEDFQGAFRTFENDPSISRIVISANGKFFCTGMDLSQAALVVGKGGDASLGIFKPLKSLFELIDNSSKVTIACINGPAFGGGIGLAFSCDIRICLSSATFTLSEVKLGLCPALISRYVIREWGLALSRDAMLTARAVSASELKVQGAVSLLADTPAELRKTVEQLIRNLRHSSPRGSKMSKDLSALFQRISAIESKLAELSGQPPKESCTFAGTETSFEAEPQFSNDDAADIFNLEDQVSISPSGSSRDASINDVDLSKLPPDAVMQSLIDTYFTHCNNQPYGYFHEETFRQKLAENSLPKCVVLAVLASSMRFSDHEFYAGVRAKATEAYAREAWLSVLTDHMTAEDSPDLHVAQATNILAIIDFTYRHLAISDEDCSVRLPCDEPTFRNGGLERNLTLHQLHDWNTDPSSARGNFPIAILAGSALGRCTRNVLHDREVDGVPPWDSRSEYASINSILLLVESRLQMDQISIDSIVETNRTEDGSIDHQVVGHVIFARTVFHLCHCLLNHPFLLRRRLRGRNGQAPSSFLLLAFQRSYDHARSLINVLHDAAAAGCHLGASFYAYSACLAGSSLSLNMHAEKHHGGQRSAEMLRATQESLSILEKMGQFWDHASKMHRRLLAFNSHAHLFTSLFNAHKSPDLGPELEAALWSMIDYGSMCRDSNLSVPSPTLVLPSETPFSVSLELGGDQGLGLADSPSMVLSNIDSTAMSFDTPSISYLFELASSGG